MSRDLRTISRVEITDRIGNLRRDGAMLSAAAERLGLDISVPTCPDWTVKDLLLHLGGVHRWAAIHVAERRSRPAGDLDDVVRAWPDDTSLAEWFREGHADLVRTLETADRGLVCWTFLPAPSPLSFWARRQAHETAIHRADVEGAGGEITPFPADFAADGIDELLFCFAGRPGGTLKAAEPCTLHIDATDGEGEWFGTLGPDGFKASRTPAAADCVVRGTTSELYLLLWNRCGTERLEVSGDGAVLDRWRTSVQITWS